MRTAMMWFVCTCLAASALPAATVTATAAVRQAASPSALANVKALRCTFTQAAVGGWTKDGAGDAALKSSTLTLRLEAIDSDAGTAQLKTGSMSSELTARLSGGYLHFMQVFRTGPMYTTTVFEGAPGKPFKAVHSRHEYFTVPVPGSTSSPEQYYGECVAVG
jgi:hypothetical protein